jgi:hypothetical protein
MLIGSMTNAATSRRLSRCSIWGSAFASSGGAILPQCGSRLLMRSRSSAARSDAHQNVPKHSGPTIYPHTGVFQHASPSGGVYPALRGHLTQF